MPKLRQPGPSLTAAQQLATADCPGLTSLQQQLMRQIMPRTICSAGNAAVQAAAEKAGLKELSTLLHNLIQEDLHKVVMQPPLLLQQQQPDIYCQVDDDPQGGEDTDHDNTCTTNNNSSSRGYSSVTVVDEWQLPNCGLRGKTARLPDEKINLKRAEPAWRATHCIAPHGISSSRSSKCGASVLSAHGQPNGKPPGVLPTSTVVSACSPRPATTHLRPNSISNIEGAAPITHPTPDASCSTVLYDLGAKPPLSSPEKLAVGVAASSQRQWLDSISNPSSARHRHGACEVSGVTQDDALSTAAVLHSHVGPASSTRHQRGACEMAGITQAGALYAAAVVHSHSGPAGASSCSAAAPVADFRDWEPWYAALAALVE